MFEKESEELVKDYIIKSRDCLMFPCKTLEDCKDQELDFDEVVELVKDGAKFGYSKANKWHKVADGDLPQGEDAVLIYWKFGERCCFSVVEPYKVTEDTHIIAWCELPKYEEE